jgi:hypothetical protein
MTTAISTLIFLVGFMTGYFVFSMRQSWRETQRILDRLDQQEQEHQEKGVRFL